MSFDAGGKSLEDGPGLNRSNGEAPLKTRGRHFGAVFAKPGVGRKRHGSFGAQEGNKRMLAQS